ncbi:uncharacterized protein [Rutidosis leptorrhynchoides]|uniref:uncharacterized protein n=1 Tax=Rutidosis leptorrhynchoides TaxID=125765 RepID=UPI003A992EC2
MAFKKDGQMVDENMIVLRERIRKIEAETECDNQYPDNWMEWEKTYVYNGGYHSDVYEAVAFLQRFFMDNRPSVVLGLVVFFALGGSIGMITVLQWLINSVHGN